jgi:hypothetical protein
MFGLVNCALGEPLDESDYAGRELLCGLRVARNEIVECCLDVSQRLR